MTADRDLDQKLRSWLEERAMQRPPDGLLERSLERVDTTRQRPGWLVKDRGRAPGSTGRRTSQPAWAGRLLAITVAIVVVTTGAVLLVKVPRSPAAANQPQTIHLLEPGGNGTDVHIGSLTGCSATVCQGDYTVGDDPLLDAATNKQVGTILYACFVVDAASGLYHCPAITLDLTGRGQIVYTSNVYLGTKWQPEPWPIIGGTGEFLGATGTVTSPQFQTSSGGDYVITFTK